MQRWQDRRVAYSKTRLLFTLIGDDDMIRDQIPLHEIKKIEIMSRATDIDLDTRARQNDDERHQSVSSMGSNHIVSSRTSGDRDDACPKVIQIETIPDGYNSGRVYYLKTESTECCESIVEELRSYAKAAKERKAGNSSFQKLQTIELPIHDSIPFQIVSALLIIAVQFFCLFLQYRPFRVVLMDLTFLVVI